jgi:pyruvate decarboxylase
MASLRFVLNNGGYTIERLIHGPEADYNTVAEYDYSALAKAFGPKFSSKYHGPIRTAEELVRLIGSGKLREDSFQLVEVILGKLDAPLSVRNTGAAVGRFNEKK